MRTLLAVVVVGLLSLWWVRERATRIGLEARLAPARQAAAEVGRLEAERQELSRQRPGAEEIARLQRDAAEAQRLQREVSSSDAGEEAKTGLGLGEWTRADEWKNRGNGTPRDAVETALWAAAGGEQGALKRALELSDEVRARVTRELARLSPRAQAQYPTPEDLVAAYTLSRIPLGEAQMILSQQADADHAVVGLYIQNSDAPAPAAVKQPSDPTNNAPPQLSELAGRRIVFLTLHRTDAGWRLVVPLRAMIDIGSNIGSTAPDS